MVRDTFPLPRIDKALQAVHSSNYLCHLTSLMGTFNWPRRRATFRKQLLEPDHQASKSLLTCLLAYQMQALAFVVLWSNV